MDNPASILVVDDDQRLCDLLRRYLSREGYRISTVLSGEQMRRHIQQDMPDLVLLDLVLPDADGLLLAKELQVHRRLGIIILTGKGETVDRIVGLEVGADDYISKPFDNRELLARIHSVLRRVKAEPDNSNTQPFDKSAVHFSGWVLDLASHELISPEGKQIHLTSKEFKLLSLLAKNSKRVMSRTQILDAIDDREWTPDDRRIDVLVGKLRKKIERGPDKPVFIKTIRSEGYMFTAKIDVK